MDAAKAVDAFINTIVQAVANDDGVSLVGFGTFVVGACGARRQESEDGREADDRRSRRAEVLGWRDVQGGGRQEVTFFRHKRSAPAVQFGAFFCFTRRRRCGCVP